MPGTTYTREGPVRDPIGRLADFARFSVTELDEIRTQMLPPLSESTKIWLAAARNVTVELAGYTTADDD